MLCSICEKNKDTFLKGFVIIVPHEKTTRVVFCSECIETLHSKLHQKYAPPKESEPGIWEAWSTATDES
jgi:hypothetical protein